MPEGPSILILKELVEDFAGKKVLHAEGNAKIDKQRVIHQNIKAIKSWGKHFLMEFSGFAIRVHFLMFGSYKINERKEVAPRLSLQFTDGTELNFYSCSVKYIEGLLDDFYDWRNNFISSCRAYHWIFTNMVRVSR